MNVSILPSAIVDIVRGRCFYDGLEVGLGMRFQDYIFEEIDKLEDFAGIHEVHFSYYRALPTAFIRTSITRSTVKMLRSGECWISDLTRGALNPR